VHDIGDEFAAALITFAKHRRSQPAEQRLLCLFPSRKGFKKYQVITHQRQEQQIMD
jgi:hypothetical protein